MATATITPKYVNQPREGKKNGTVKMGNDKFTLDRDYLVPQGMLAQLQPNVPVNIEYRVSEEGWRTIMKVSPAGNGAVTGTQGTQSSPQYASNDKDEHIFVCGLLNQMAAAGNILPDPTTNEVAKVGRWLRNQYKEIWKPLTQAPAQTGKPSAADEMSDEIPF